MENKIVRMKTFVITISLLVLLFLIGIGGCVYYYENKVDELERMLNASKAPSGITIVPGGDTDVNNVTAE